jgi:hypothetical protein
MTLKFQNTKEDYYKSLAFIFPKTFGFRWYIILLLAIAMLLFGIATGIHHYLHRENYSWYTPDVNGAMTLHQAQQTLYDALHTPGILVTLGIVYFILHFFRARAYASRMLKRQQFLLEPTEIIFSEEGIEIKRTSTKSFLEWVTVKSVYERPEFFGILFTGSSFIPITKKYLTETEIAELRKLLSTKKEILTK